ncbi:MAG: MBL fold metallo-hydrolase RNA specificity domain-containing protein [Bacteroidia bacterium]
MDNNGFHIHFLGAAGTVTGSKYLIETPKKKILVDCGLFQGLKTLRLHNWEDLPVDVHSIDFVLLTHGHLDHVGYLPRLVKAGFKGRIYGTEPTLDIAEIVLKDTAKIQEEEAERANKHHYSKHKPAKALYNVKDAERTFPHFSVVKPNEWIDFGNDIKARFQTNGHIIGSTFIELHIGNKKLVFSGDVGQVNDLLLNPPKRPQEADILFIESTYGDRIHPNENIKERLKTIVLETIAKGGNVIIPSFAVERTQTLMFLLWQLRKENDIPEIPFIMDSPMGNSVLDVFQKHVSWHKLPKADCKEMCKQFKLVTDFKETIAIIADQHPKIIIAGSGMVAGGRVLSYLQHYVSKPETTVLFVGFQSEGTRGRRMQSGSHEIKIYGKYYEVNARIETIHGLSAHGDQKDLIDWLSEIKIPPQKVFIVHGESQAADAFRVKLKDTYGWDCTLPKLYDIVQIED